MTKSSQVDQDLIRAIAELGQIGLPVSQPRDGGFYLWAELPPGTDELELCRSAARQGIFLAPGSVFVPDRKATEPALRINVAHASNPDFLSFLQSSLRP